MIPEVVISDNGQQYVSEAFAQFAREYQFQHIMSRPGYPQSIGEAERAVKTIKDLLKKVGDPYMALVSYRTTPLQTSYSPSQLLMGRKLRTSIPTTHDQLVPKLPDPVELRERDMREKRRQEKTLKNRHQARELEANTRLYQVETGEGLYLRN